MTGAGDADRWARLDDSLAVLRDCRSAEELARCAAPAAVAGCGALGAEVWAREVPAAEASVGQPSVVPRMWSRAGPSALLDDPRLGLRRRLSTGSRVYGELRVIGGAKGRSPAPDLLDAFSVALASMIALTEVWQRAEDTERALERLASGLTAHVDSPLELAGPPPRVDPGPVRDRLTARQREVLALLLAGLSNAEIADRLVLSVSTVKSHVRAILRAGGAVNRAEAIARLSRSVEPRRYDDVL
ncbi:MAG TPA: helix-turn-helix transcriptional regulator [Amycolatopsis sp.]|nr:helix-turn-helix transcriptional regulator [Amycolatopsis sp.]